VAEAFYLLTLGGARVLGIEDKIGNFAVGKVCQVVKNERSSYLLSVDGVTSGF